MGNAFFKELTLWLSHVLGGQVTRESVFNFVINVRRLMDGMPAENLGEDITGIFVAVERETGGIKFVNCFEKTYEEASSVSVVTEDLSGSWDDTQDMAESKEVITESAEEMVCATAIGEKGEEATPGIFKDISIILYLNNSLVKKICAAGIAIGIIAMIMPSVQFDHTMGYTTTLKSNAVVTETDYPGYQPEQNTVEDKPVSLQEDKPEPEVAEKAAQEEKAEPAETGEQHIEENQHIDEGKHIEENQKNEESTDANIKEDAEESTDKKIEVNTKESASESTASSNDANRGENTGDECFDSIPKIRMKATAYDLSIESCGKDRNHPLYGITYTGTKATVGRTIAVDPKVIPLGSRVKITFPEKYRHMDGIYIAEDTGSLVKGNHIDIFWGEDEAGSSEVNKSAKRFGVQYVEVQILK
ncbi:MAG: hypothetical protein GX066_03955 [Clostridiaceae bacterium]|nr:hypothetical protein [Clostridiaceae bacterium]